MSLVRFAEVFAASPLAARARHAAVELLRDAAALSDEVANPFDSSMIKGVGRNNIEYEADYPNVPGGILNGVTGGFEDERDIAFTPEEHRATGNGWRRTEQWIPHPAWFLLAMPAAR